VENSGTTFVDATIAVSSVDIVIHNIDYEYQKIEGADTSSNLTLPIQQRVDRNYRNP
jgi:type I restriction-modification system DNA methylase subunit